MHIEKLTPWIEETLEAMARVDLPTHIHSCPHCGLPVRYPTVAREEDIRDFASLMAAAERVCQERGITALLLAEIRAKCLLNKLK